MFKNSFLGIKGLYRELEVELQTNSTKTSQFYRSLIYSVPPLARNKGKKTKVRQI